MKFYETHFFIKIKVSVHNLNDIILNSDININFAIITTEFLEETMPYFAWLPITFSLF